MFTEKTIFYDTVSLARNDIRVFFDSDFKFDFDHTDYTSFIDILRQIDSSYFTHRFNEMGSLEFIDKFLKWLKDTRKEKRNPWVGRGDNLQLSQDEKGRKIVIFLRYLKEWINKLIIPGDIENIGYGSPFLTGHKFWKFALFIGKTRLIEGEWDIHIQEVKEEDKNLLRGFVSWLVFVKSQPVLYIIYDKEKILRNSNLSVSSGYGSVVFRARKRRIILHELGHARTELSWFLDHVNAARDTTWIRSYPMHEYKAWTYALAIRSLLVCIRSRITRILGEGDTEWLSYV